MKRWLVFLPVLAGIIFTEHFLWERSGKKLEIVFGAGVANDQMADKIREGMSTADLEDLLGEDDPAQVRFRIRGLMELAEKEIGQAARFRKLKKNAAEQAANRRAAGYYWSILDTYQEGYDVMDITGRLNQVLDPRDTAAARRLTGILEAWLTRTGPSVNRDAILIFLARMYNRIEDTARESACLEQLVKEGRSQDVQIIIDLVKACLRLGAFDRAWELYTGRLRTLLTNNDAVFDAALDMLEVFFRAGRGAQGLEVAGHLEAMAASDQRRVQVAACVLRDAVPRDRAQADALYLTYRGRMSDQDWINVLDGEAWVLGLIPATTKRFYRVDRVAPGAVTVDGRLDEPCWDDNCAADFIDDDGVPLAAEPVRAWVRHDGEKVYFAFHCVDPDIAHLVTENGVTEEGVWRDDSIEIFLDVRRTYRVYYQIMFNTEGRKGDWYNRNIAYECPRLERKVFIDRANGYWDIEVALYAADLEGAALAPGTVWYGNLCKDGYLPEKPGRPTAAFFDEYYYAGVWSYTEGDNHRLQNYGYLVFR